jgi:GntR family transcriptional repressor for pyruvate dehydrogenase complex
MAEIKKIPRDGVCDQVYTQLKGNILNGTWKPGDKIPSENRLVSLFGVSRASIRMALQRMITLGLLESRVGAGTYVKAFNPGNVINEIVSLTLKPDDQIEIMEFRKALEMETLRLAVERATDEDLQDLEEIHIRARKAFRELDLETYFKEDMKFHRQIFQMSKNSIFMRAFETLHDVLFPHFYSVAKDFFKTNEVPSDEADQHTVIVNALKNKDIETCVNAYTKLTEDLTEMYRLLQRKEKTEG